MYNVSLLSSGSILIKLSTMALPDLASKFLTTNKPKKWLIKNAFEATQITFEQ